MFCNFLLIDYHTKDYSISIQRSVYLSAYIATQHLQDADVVKMRLNQYKLAALKAKQAGQRDLAIEHMKVVKVKKLYSTISLKTNSKHFTYINVHITHRVGGIRIPRENLQRSTL